MTSIDDLAHVDNMSKLGKVGHALGSMLLGGMIFLSAGMAYKSCFGSRTIENTTITEKGTHEVSDYETGYSETQNTININKHKRCIRGPYPFGTNLRVGYELKEIKYRPGLGPCDYYVSHKR